MLPVITIVGRPNVGKSTLFNVLTKSKAALVADFPGVTRDRQYGQGSYDNKPFMLVDTCGLGEEDNSLDKLASQQASLALEEADVIFFVVDGRAGLTPIDLTLAADLRRMTKPIFLLINKSESLSPEMVAADFQGMGFKQIFCISSAHSRGIADVMEAATREFPAHVEAGFNVLDAESLPIRVAVLGRPNVGKSTFINKLLGKERVIVYDMPGTTRDTIEVPVNLYGRNYIFMDTAGVRRRGRISEKIEKFSVIKTLQAVDSADVCLVILNSEEPITDQDMHLLDYVMQAGKGMVIAFNKSDVIDAQAKKQIEDKIDLRMPFQTFYQIRFISALKGFGMRELWNDILKAYQATSQKHATSYLTRLLQEAVANHQPPLVKGRRIKLRFAHMGGVKPPLVVIHGNQVEELPDSYQKYLKNFFLEALNLKGTPLELQLKSSTNPFAHKKNQLSTRQLTKKKRLKRFLKKKHRS